jgi:hypothetical protein
MPKSVPIQTIGNKELVLPSDAISWRSDASLVEIIPGGFNFNVTGQRACFATSEMKFVKIN